jgi:hypothetical protein
MVTRRCVTVTSLPLPRKGGYQVARDATSELTNPWYTSRATTQDQHQAPEGGHAMTDTTGTLPAVGTMTDGELEREIRKHGLALDDMTADDPSRPAMQDHLDQYAGELAERKRLRREAPDTASDHPSYPQ